ncbi:MAG: alpha/beta hydrolase [Paludibacteraceae bacterium]|nr:alpha/beta hydrolase [Paludibacteraceae bacterium]
MKIKILTLFFCFIGLSLSANEYTTKKDISYTYSTNKYALERCKLDIYYPKKQNNCPVIVWFHGGGLTSGNKDIPYELKEKGYVVVGVNYRLMPHVSIDSCINDAANAVAWCFNNIKNYNGDVSKIYVSGHSAGGYLSAMIGLDKTWLEKFDIDANQLKAIIPFSGQMITHFAHRDSQGIGNLQPTIDRYAPLYHVRKDGCPIILITGGRDIELFGRYEENAYMYRMLLLNGHQGVELYELDGHDHGAMAHPAFHILINTIEKN